MLAQPWTLILPFIQSHLKENKMNYRYMNLEERIRFLHPYLDNEEEEERDEEEENEDERLMKKVSWDDPA